MSEQTLNVLLPKVKKFCGAAGYYIKKGVYPRYPDGRPYDDFIYVVEVSICYDFYGRSFEIKK